MGFQTHKGATMVQHPFSPRAPLAAPSRTSTFSAAPPTASWNTLTSMPGMAQPTLPQTWASSVDQVQAPVHSDMPYTSLILMPMEAK